MDPSTINDHTIKSVRDALESSGALTNLRAQLRAKIFSVLEPGSLSGNSAQPPEIMIIHELIREYLQFAGFEHSNSVFLVESGLQNTELPRAVLVEELNLPGAAVEVPLLLALVSEAIESRNT